MSKNLVKKFLQLKALQQIQQLTSQQVRFQSQQGLQKTKTLQDINRNFKDEELVQLNQAELQKTSNYVKEQYEGMMGRLTAQDIQRKQELLANPAGLIRESDQIDYGFNIQTKPDLVEKYLDKKYHGGFQRKMNQEAIITKEFQRHAYDTTSPEVIAALLTYRINRMNKYLKQFKKDKQAQKKLIEYIDLRWKLLRKLRMDNFDRYAKIIARFGLRDIFMRKTFPMVYPVGSNIKPSLQNPKNPYNWELKPEQFEIGAISTQKQAPTTYPQYDYWGKPIQDIEEIRFGKKLLTRQEENMEPFYDTDKQRREKQDYRKQLNQKSDELVRDSTQQFVDQQESRVDLTKPLPNNYFNEGKVKNFLQERLQKYHVEAVMRREQEEQIERLERTEKYWLSFLQSRVWCAIRRDHRSEEELNSFNENFISQFDKQGRKAVGAKTRKCNWEIYQNLKDKPIHTMNKNEQRMFMPWYIGGKRRKREERTKKFTETYFEYLRKKAPLFYESRLYNTKYWSQSLFDRLPKGPANLERLKQEDEKLLGQIDQNDYGSAFQDMHDKGNYTRIRFGQNTQDRLNEPKLTLKYGVPQAPNQ